MSVISGVTGSIMGAQASNSAAEQGRSSQMYALMQSLALQKQMYDDQIGRQQPFYNQGIASLEDYAKMLKGGYDMKESPAAQYELSQATKAMNRQLGARGMLGGGIAANRLSELSSGIAAKDWQNQYSRLVDSLKMATGASASMGQSGSTFGNQAGSQFSNNANAMSNIAQNQGNNMMGLYQNAANSIGNTGAMAGYGAIKNGWGSSAAGSGVGNLGITGGDWNIDWSALFG